MYACLGRNKKTQCDNSDFSIILRKCFINISDHVSYLARGHLSLD